MSDLNEEYKPLVDSWREQYRDMKPETIAAVLHLAELTNVEPDSVMKRHLRLAKQVRAHIAKI